MIRWLKRWWAYRGNGKDICICSFSRAAHKDHDLEWDIDDYPCITFRRDYGSKSE